MLLCQVRSSSVNRYFIVDFKNSVQFKEHCLLGTEMGQWTVNCKHYFSLMEPTPVSFLEILMVTVHADILKLLEFASRHAMTVNGIAQLIGVAKLPELIFKIWAWAPTVQGMPNTLPVGDS